MRGRGEQKEYRAGKGKSDRGERGRRKMKGERRVKRNVREKKK